MERRRFLQMLGLAPVAAVASTKAYSFLGGILRPRAVSVLAAAPQLIIQASNDMINWFPYTGTAITSQMLLQAGTRPELDLLDVGRIFPEVRYFRHVIRTR